MFVGLDLTDPFSRVPRGIDIALVTEGGEVDFDLLAWHPGVPPRFADLADEIARRFPRSEHFLVIDGPQALATPGNSRRRCEALTRTPARTPDALPEADGRPFAGYVRGSVLLWRELMRSGWIVAEELDQIRPGRMAEAFPGDAWRRLSPHRLPSKATVPGREARLALLRQLGLGLPASLFPSHDQLDSALCAALGYWPRNGVRSVELVGEPLRMKDDALREGYILSPVPEVQVTAAPPLPARVEAQSPIRTASLGSPDLSVSRPRLNTATQRKRPDVPRLGPGEVWVYFAHSSQANQAKTFEIIEEEHVLWRPAVSKPPAGKPAGQAIANLRRVRPGDAIVVVHGRSMLGAFLGTADGVTLLPIGDFPPCVAEVPLGSPLRERFLTAGYDPLDKVTVLVLEDVRALPDDLEVPVQRGRNAIQRVARPDLLKALQDQG